MSTRVQTFVGGAIALIGFRALFWIPHGLAVRDSVYILAGMLVRLGLPLGVAMLRRRPEAFRFAVVYLALGVLGMCVVFGVSKFSILSPGAPHLSWWSLSDLLAPAVLLALLLWSRARQDKKNVEQAVQRMRLRHIADLIVRPCAPTTYHGCRNQIVSDVELGKEAVCCAIYGVG